MTLIARHLVEVSANATMFMRLSIATRYGGDYNLIPFVRVELRLNSNIIFD